MAHATEIPTDSLDVSLAHGNAHLDVSLAHETARLDDLNGGTGEQSALSGHALTPPPGMRDLLPPESRARRRVSEQLQRVFERYGYELITTPLFERVEVFERGLSVDPRDLVRFVDPETGEIAALRPDMTPQIARVVATRLSELPMPWRMRYEGTVIRRRRGRARRERQIAQVGIELIGVSDVQADVEVIRCCAEAVQAAGLCDFRIELSEVGVGRAMLACAGAHVLALAAEPLARKDEARLMRVLSDAGVSLDLQQRMTTLLHLHGGPEVIDRAETLVAGTAAAPHLASLREVTRRLTEVGLGSRIGVDLGEIRGAQYYTGVSFGLYAAGPGEAVASGGRYDDLLARYGRAQPATGAAIDVENLLSALDAAGHPWRDRDSLRLLLTGTDPERMRAVGDAVRAHGIVVSSLPSFDVALARTYARAWSFDAILVAHPERTVAHRTGGESERELTSLSLADIEALTNWVRAPQKE